MDASRSDATGWRAFQARHLHDYTTAAVRLWVVTGLCGGTAVGWALLDLVSRRQASIVEIAGGIVVAMLAAAFPVHIPRSKYSFAAGDIVVFLLLAVHGSAPAVLAAAAESGVAACRTTRRISSRVASVCAAALGMTVAGAVAIHIEPVMLALGAPAPIGRLASLAAAALAYLAVSTSLLMQIVCLKQRRWLGLREWLAGTSWVGTFYLISSMVAGLLALGLRAFGVSAAVFALAVIGISIALVRIHFREQEAAHRTQEARTAAAENESEQSQKRFHAAFTRASIGMAILSADGRIVQSNHALAELLGVDAGELPGTPFDRYLQEGDAILLERRLGELVGQPDARFSIELRCRDARGRELWVSLHCASFADPTVANGGVIVQLHDITSRRRAEGALQHIAYHDGLTDLANRACFLERLSIAVDRFKDDQRSRFAVMFLDLDRFKNVNDTLGHPAGDELLKVMARRLAEAVRPGDLVARLGGDEFAILLEESVDEDSAVALGESLLAVVSERVSINGTEVRAQASIGITMSESGRRGPHDLLRDADIAMYQAKTEGRGRVARFDAALRDTIRSKLELEVELRRAIAASDLSLAYQPLFRIDRSKIEGFEALARWNHPIRGAVSPAVFIALAEETGCIGALTEWAIDEATRQLSVWRTEYPDARDLVVHVNVSGSDLSRSGFVTRVREALARHRLPARWLTLEITESALMENRDRAIATLSELVTLGVRISIDDFGTGYSSLAYLANLPFHCMKIDRSFVVGMERSNEHIEIVRTIVALARVLDKSVIAEGIETADQLARLAELGAKTGQGYLLSPPLAAQTVPARCFHAKRLAA